MENAERVRSYCERKGIRPVPICGIDEFPSFSMGQTAAATRR